MELELIDDMYLWSARISMLFLTVIATMYHRKKRNMISSTILIGTAMVFYGHLIDYLAYLFLFHKETDYTWFKVVRATKYLIIPGYFIADLGCFFNVMKSEVAASSHAKGS